MWLTDRYRLISTAAERHLPEAADTAGDSGEVAALAALREEQRGRAGRLYGSLRVPRHEAQGKYEFDVVVVTPHLLYGIEVKHWGGSLAPGPRGKWRQMSSQGESRDHEDPTLLIAAKLEAMAHYLKRQKIPFDRRALRSLVVLTNPRLALDHRLEQQTDVVRLTGLQQLVGNSLWPDSAGWIPTLLRRLRLARSTPPAFEAYSGLVAALDRLPTWDRVLLHGGQTLKGDLVRPEIALTQGRPIHRRQAARIVVHMPRNMLLGWFQTPRITWFDRSGGRSTAPVRSDQQLVLKLAGQSATRHIPLAHVREIEFGWQDESYYDAPKPALVTYSVGRQFHGKVSGRVEFGIFVDLDGHRDGLVHISQLRRRSPSDFQEGQTVRVRVLSTSNRGGKERIELELLD